MLSPVKGKVAGTSLNKNMTQSDFIKKYCEDSNITEEFLNKRGWFSVLCECQYEKCQGWAMVKKENLEDHLDLYLSPPNL